MTEYQQLRGRLILSTQKLLMVTFFLRYCPVVCVWEDPEWELTEGALEWESDKTNGCFNACLSALVQPYRSAKKKKKNDCMLTTLKLNCMVDFCTDLVECSQQDRQMYP